MALSAAADTAPTGSALLAGLDWSIVRPPDIDSLTSVDGWRDFLAARGASQPPVALTPAQHRSLSRNERTLYDIARGAWHANLPKLRTPMAEEVMEAIRCTLEVNMQKRDSAVRRGVIVSANSGHGKTTVILKALAEHEELLAMLYRRSGGSPRVHDRYIPVVAVTCPPKATISKLCYRILDFFGMPYSERQNDGLLGDKVRKCLQACGTKVLFIDEISRLNMQREDAQITFDFIRDLQDSYATVILAGVDIEHTGLLTEGQYLRDEDDLKTQTEKRFTRLPLPAFTQDSPAKMQAWVDHLRGVEEQILLMDKYDGMLSEDHADWLYDHTDKGVIGSLSHIVEQACLRAIERGRQTGTEVIDLDILKRVHLDWGSEKQMRAEAEAAARGAHSSKPGKAGKATGKRRSHGDDVYAARR